MPRLDSAIADRSSLGTMLRWIQSAKTDLWVLLETLVPNGLASRAEYVMAVAVLESGYRIPDQFYREGARKFRGEGGDGYDAVRTLGGAIATSIGGDWLHDFKGYLETGSSTAHEEQVASEKKEREEREARQQQWERQEEIRKAVKAAADQEAEMESLKHFEERKRLLEVGGDW
jgi:hypothetical protein